MTIFRWIISVPLSLITGIATFLFLVYILDELDINHGLILESLGYCACAFGFGITSTWMMLLISPTNNKKAVLKIYFACITLSVFIWYLIFGYSWQPPAILLAGFTLGSLLSGYIKLPKSDKNKIDTLDSHF